MDRHLTCILECNFAFMDRTHYTQLILDAIENDKVIVILKAKEKDGIF